jgi:hypothetical protein
MKGNPMRFLATLAVLATALPAHATPQQDPTADYTAVMVATTAGHAPVESKLWYTRDKVRVDVTRKGQPVTVILDKPAKKMTIIVPKSKLYQQANMPKSGLQNPLATGDWQIAKVSEETVEGVPTTKWRVNGKDADGQGFHGYIWTTEQHIQVRMEGEAEASGKTVKVTSELRDLKVGPIDPAVFQIPQDYKPLPKD